jgi:hypothetical protein
MFISKILRGDIEFILLNLHRADQTFKYFLVNRETTAREVVMLALQEFVDLQNQASRDYALFQVCTFSLPGFLLCNPGGFRSKILILILFHKFADLGNKWNTEIGSFAGSVGFLGGAYSAWFPLLYKTLLVLNSPFTR